MSLVIKTDHNCTQLISGRDDVLPWIQLEQPYRSATREDNTRWHDQYTDGVRNMISLLWLDTDGCRGDGL